MLKRILILLGETPSSAAAREYAFRLVQGTVDGKLYSVLVSYEVPVCASLGDDKLYLSRGYANYSATTKKHVRNYSRGWAPSQIEWAEHSVCEDALIALVGRGRLDP